MMPVPRRLRSVTFPTWGLSGICGIGIGRTGVSMDGGAPVSATALVAVSAPQKDSIQTDRVDSHQGRHNRVRAIPGPKAVA